MGRVGVTVSISAIHLGNNRRGKNAGLYSALFTDWFLHVFDIRKKSSQVMASKVYGASQV
jgi:hypothetical protein